MAKCKYCGKEILDHVSCDCKHVKIDGELFDRIKFGDEGYFEDKDIWDGTKFCGDCGCPIGAYHHPNCDMEETPKPIEICNNAGYVRTTRQMLGVILSKEIDKNGIIRNSGRVEFLP